MTMLTWPVIALGWVVNLVQRGTASVTRIHEILIAEPSISDGTLPATGAVTTEIHGGIEFRNLCFTYDNATAPVLRDINLRIPAGSSFAIVGPTGSGKTTLVRLIPRLLEAQRGMLQVDGHAVMDYPLAKLQKRLDSFRRRRFSSASQSAKMLPLELPLQLSRKFSMPLPRLI